MRIPPQCPRLFALLISLASGLACSAQNLVTVGYIVKQPVRIGTSGVSVESVGIYGSSDAPIDSYLDPSESLADRPLHLTAEHIRSHPAKLPRRKR
jgi:hypothetical protein